MTIEVKTRDRLGQVTWSFSLDVLKKQISDLLEKYIIRTKDRKQDVKNFPLLYFFPIPNSHNQEFHKF